MITIEQAGSPPEVEPVRKGKFVWKKIEYSIHNDADLDALTPQIEQLRADVNHLLLRLKLDGVANLELRAKLDIWIAEWKSRLHYLEVDDRKLIAEPTENDLDQIARRGFIRTASNRLRELASNLENPDRDIAKAALMRLYQKRV